MKRIIAVMMCLIILSIIILPLAEIVTFAENSIVDSGTCGDNLTWTLSIDGTLTISGTGDMKKYTYYNAAPWHHKYYRQIKTIIIENGVTNIGNYAFYFCTSIVSVTIPDSVTSIGNSAFEVCDSLTSITIPDSITNIGYKAFSRCENLTEIVVSENNECYCSVDGVLFNKDKTTIVQYPIGKADITYKIPDSVTIIGDSAFEQCDSLKSIIIPDSVTSIGKDVFYGTAYYEDETNWENGVLYIGNYAIEAKSSMGDYEIKYGTRVIADYAFEYCNGSTIITIPDSVTSIGDYAFSWCKEIVVSENNECYCSIDGVLLNKDKTTIIQYPIGKNDTTYKVPESVISIGNGAFYFCTSLTSVTIPDSVTSIGDFAFDRCESLTSMTIPEGVTSIGEAVFQSCTSLTSVTMPDSVTTIGEWTFNGCNSLTDVYYGGSEEWNNIAIGERNDNLTNATIHYNWVSEDDGGLKVNYTVENNVVKVECENIKAGYVVYAAMYTDGVVKAVKLDLNGGNDSFVLDNNADKVKIFVWKSLESMMPILDAVTVE